MKFTKASVILGVSALVASITAPAIAQDSSGWYAGANVGRSDAKIDDERIARGLLGQGLATDSIDDRAMRPPPRSSSASSLIAGSRSKSPARVESGRAGRLAAFRPG